MIDDVYRAFLFEAAREAPRFDRESPIMSLAAAPASGSPPASYLAVLREIEHFERAADGTVCLSARPIPFTITFPADYLRSIDRTLQFRVVRVRAPLFHPNCRADGTLCLGSRFRPGTALGHLLETIHRILSLRVVATQDAFDARARDYFLGHAAEVRRLRERAPSLWGRRVAARVRTEPLDPAERRQAARP